MVVPIYNAEHYLDKCILSILNQTFQDIELILVNDGSTDTSLEKCINFKNKDKRIVLINKKNEGSIATRKKGVQAATSNYVMFVDADDWIDKRMIEVLYTESLANSLDVTVCNMYKVLGNSKLIKRKNNSSYFKEDRIYEKGQIMSELVVAYFHGFPFPANLWGKLYTKELLLDSGSFLKNIHFFGDDLFYNLEIFLKANRVKVIDKPLYYYRAGGNTSKFMPFFFDDIVNGYEIQKEVIGKYYIDTKQKQLNGISVMLLNTFKTVISNLFIGGLEINQIEEKIHTYVSNESIQEAIINKASVNYFSDEFLAAIKNKDISYLYGLGYKSHKFTKVKKQLINIVSRLGLT